MKIIMALSYVCIIIGSIGLMKFAEFFPFTMYLWEQEYTGKKKFGLNGYEWWRYSWWFIIIGTTLQLIIFIIS
jgi:hypothetical protein